MWQYNQSNELYHYGVPGMKWGTRRSRGAYQTAKTNFKVKKSAEIDNFNAYDKRGSSLALTKSSKIAKTNAFNRFNKSVKETDKARVGYKKAKQNYKADKKAYKEKVNKDNESYTKKQRTLDRTLFNKATEKRVNQYLNTGSSLKSARTKSYAEAGANTAAILLGAYGVYKIATR